MKFSDIPAITDCVYTINVGWDYLRKWLKDQEDEIGLELDPEFQRGHVWTLDQQSRYIEFVLQGGRSGRDIYFNCKNWGKSFDGVLQLVDGKQRMTAVLDFLENKIPIFEKYYFRDFDDKLDRMVHSFIININDLDEIDVLKWYIFLNSGVAHTEEEIDKVKRMIEELKNE